VGGRLTGDELSCLGQLPNLRSLYLDSSQLRSEDVIRLGSCQALEFFGLYESSVDDKAIDYLIGLSLQTIDVGNSCISKEGIARLRARIEVVFDGGECYQ